MNEKKVNQKIEKEQLSRGLKNRHIQMIAIGSAIGVGLFYGAAGAIQTAGPSTILAYGIVGIAIYFVMRALGEMSVEEPVSGAYVSYASRYIHPFFGFYLVCTVFLAVLATSTAEYNALGQYIQFWFPSFPIWATASIILVIVIIINFAAVKAYGEMEFWLSAIKVAAIIGMIILGGAMILFGIGNGGQTIGFSNLTANGGFFPMGAKGFILSFVVIAFAFGGVEFVGITAGESDNPKKTIPQAINGVFWRILIFYVGAITVMMCLYNWKLIGTQGSPFVSVFSKMGIPAAASIINLVVISAGLSSMNSNIYTSGRMLYNLALQGRAPKIFTKLNKNNVPFFAVLAMIVAQLLGIGLNAIMPATVFETCASVDVTYLIAIWILILVSELKFRKIRRENGTEDKMTFKMPWWPYSNYFAIIFMLFILVDMWFLPSTRIALYVLPPWVVILFAAYKITNRQKNRQDDKNADQIELAENIGSDQ